MVQNINKITTNTGSVILWNNDSIIVSIPKGMYYCHMIDGIVKIKQIGVENIFNIVKTSPIDGETFPLVEDMLEKLSSFSRGGGTGAGGAKAYESLAEAMSETPLPSDGTVFYVTEGSQDSGIYAYDSENLNGYYKVFNLPEQGSEVDLMINTTHADLLALINNSELTPGQQYRITDYVATVDTDVYNPNYIGFYARSNNHAFDIIVIADSVNQLNENARAIRHEGDTYFPLHTKFEAWKLRYTIYNDTSRFIWALSTGKGVIYQLIDEWNNDLPYDFKSIQFQRNAVWVYTFGGETDSSLNFSNCTNNTVLNNGVFLSNITFGNYCSSNTLGIQCSSNTFGDNCIFNTFGIQCSSNTFGGNCNSNTFGNQCSSNTLGYGCNLNTFGSKSVGNTFGGSCSENTFGSGCSENTFGNWYRNYNVSSSISNIDFTNQLSNFTTPPNGNTIEVIKTPTGVVMQQRISASETESFDVVI